MKKVLVFSLLLLVLLFLLLSNVIEGMTNKKEMKGVKEGMKPHKKQ